MPNGPELRELARRAFAGALFDSYLPQIIYSVRVVPGPESATREATRIESDARMIGILALRLWLSTMRFLSHL